MLRIHPQPNDPNDMTDQPKGEPMRYTVLTDPLLAGFEVGRAYNHGQHVCRHGHDECADTPRGLCPERDITPICRICRCELIGSEISHGLCGDDRTAVLRNGGGIVAAELEHPGASQ